MSRFSAFFVAVLALLAALAPAAARARTSIAFVPMYATPVARQLPLMLARIAGARVLEPSESLLGGYIEPGDVDAVDGWLRTPAVAEASAFVVSTDMLAYGGLDPSRVPGGIDTPLAIARLEPLRALRHAHPGAWIAAFGTVMRLEPTAVAPVGAAVHYDRIARYPTWQEIWDYAQLDDPPLPSEAERARALAEAIGERTLQAYLGARARDREVDLQVLRMAGDGTLNRVVIGQDDAGPIGLHVRDVRALQSELARLGIGDRASIEPGADELGLALIAQALARSVGWTPHVAVRYSMPDGASAQDPLEFAPISVTIDDLIRLCGGVHDDATPDLLLYVRVPGTDASHDDALLHDLVRDAGAGKPVALVDLTFLTRSYVPQITFVKALLRAGIAGKLDAYSSWNTNANSVGIALSEAIAAGAGRRAGTYDPIAHAEFTFDRYIEDYLYHDLVRPQVNAYLKSRGISDWWYLAPEAAADAQREARRLLDPLARQLFAQLYPQYRIASLEFSLPWPRTFELESDIRLER